MDDGFRFLLKKVIVMFNLQVQLRWERFCQFRPGNENRHRKDTAIHNTAHCRKKRCYIVCSVYYRYIMQKQRIFVFFCRLTINFLQIQTFRDEWNNRNAPNSVYTHFHWKQACHDNYCFGYWFIVQFMGMTSVVGSSWSQLPNVFT